LVNVAFTSLCERNDLLRDRSICNIRSIQTFGRGARHFERNAHYKYCIGIEFLAVQILSDRHDALSCLLTGGSATGLSATGAWHRAAVGDVRALPHFKVRVRAIDDRRGTKAPGGPRSHCKRAGDVCVKRNPALALRVPQRRSLVHKGGLRDRSRNAASASVFQPAAQKRGQRRGWGKPKENVELPDAEPRQITHIVREIVHLPPGGVQR
jgi:hypothetical protein